MPTSQMLQLWEEGRTRFSQLLGKLTEADLQKKLGNAPNSAGFLLRHIADVELLFAKNVFGAKEVEVHAKTVIAQKDTGEWTGLAALIDYQSAAYNALRAAILSQTDSDWEEMVTTKEWGTKTKAEALGRIISHTTYHAGQLAMIIKYGST